MTNTLSYNIQLMLGGLSLRIAELETQNQALTEENEALKVQLTKDKP